MQPSKQASLPASQKPKKPAECVTLSQLVPQDQKLARIVDGLAQDQFLNLSGRLGRLRTRGAGAGKLFTIHEMRRAHVRNAQVRRLIMELDRVAIIRAHHLERQLKARHQQVKTDTLMAVLAAPWKIVQSLFRKAERLVKRWLALEPTDRKIFRGLSLEQVLDGLAGSTPPWLMAR